MIKPFLRAERIPSAAIATRLNQALALHRSGRLPEALDAYQQILRSQPDHGMALYLAGTVMLQTGKFTQAQDLLRRAARQLPDHAPSHTNLALALIETHQGEEALLHAKRAVTLSPASLEAQLNLAAILLKMEQAQAALNQLEAIAPLAAKRSDFWLNRGLAQAKLGLYAEADASFAEVLALEPGHLRALNQRAINQLRAGSPERAQALAQDALQHQPSSVPLLITLARSCLALKQTERACALLATAARSSTVTAAVWVDLASAWLELGNAPAALEAVDRALQIKPDDRDAFLVAGNAFRRQHDHRSALLNYERAMEIDPALQMLAMGADALFEMERYDAVVQALGTLGDKLTSEQLSILQSARMFLCDWSDFDSALGQITTRASTSPESFNPFTMLALVDDPALHLRIAQAHAAPLPPEKAIEATPCAAGSRIRIGYYSADFQDHATMHLMAQLFESHDHSRFEVHAFSLTPPVPSTWMDRIRPHFDHFHECADRSDAQVVEHSRALGIDIAIDLKGYTRDARPALFALRCAPVQVSYLGYPGSTGMPTMDYVIADAVVIAPDHQADFSERVVYLPHSYQCNDQHRPIAARTFSRAELGLPAQGFVFCCFNNNYKILPAVFAAWMRILHQVPGSVLWLFEGNETAAHHLRRSAAQAGIDAQRLVFATRLAPAEHLARVQSADLFLDTAPYGAHTTASDALWAGVPLVTCPGRSFASRVAASLLKAVGLPELVTASLADYEALAVALATQPERLAALRQRLREARASAPLFDGALFAQHLEQAFETMHERRLAGLAPDVIHVPAQPGRARPDATVPGQRS